MARRTRGARRGCTRRAERRVADSPRDEQREARRPRAADQRLRRTADGGRDRGVGREQSVVSDGTTEIPEHVDRGRACASAVRPARRRCRPRSRKCCTTPHPRRRDSGRQRPRRAQRHVATGAEAVFEHLDANGDRCPSARPQARSCSPRAASSRLRARCRGPRARDFGHAAHRRRVTGDDRRELDVGRHLRRESGAHRGQPVPGDDRLNTTPRLRRSERRSAACVAGRAAAGCEPAAPRRRRRPSLRSWAGSAPASAAVSARGPAARRAPARRPARTRGSQVSSPRTRRHRTPGRPGALADGIDQVGPPRPSASPRP